MTTHNENESFAKEVMVYNPLDSAIDWIKTNLAPDEVFDSDALEEWAEQSGYKKE